MTECNLKETIRNEMILAMKSRDQDKLRVLRLIINNIKNYEINEQAQASNHVVFKILKKMVKQSNESLEGYLSTANKEKVAQEQSDIKFFESYLPNTASHDELQTIIDQVISPQSDLTIKELGKAIGLVKANLPEGADMAFVSAYLKKKLS